jgi:hypothetical protein
MTKYYYRNGANPSQRSFAAGLAVLIAVSGAPYSVPYALAAESLQTAANAEYPSYTNHLVGSASPYLLAHAYNPVDWYAWGEEAFARARAEQTYLPVDRLRQLLLVPRCRAHSLNPEMRG